MKEFFIFAEDNKKCSDLIKYFVKRKINHQVVLDQNHVNKLKKILEMSAPILIAKDGETGENKVLISLKELEDYING